MAADTFYIEPDDVTDAATYGEIANMSEAELQLYVDKATQIIDSYVGGSLLETTYTDKVRCVLDKPNSGLLIPLKHRPITEVTSISLMTKPTSSVSLDVDYVRIREEVGHVEYYYTLEYPYALCPADFSGSSITPIAEVAYTAGYAIIPADLKHAAVLIVEALVREENGEDTFLSRMTISNTTEVYSKKTSTEDAKSIIGDASWITVKKILSKYRQAGQSPGIAGIMG